MRRTRGSRASSPKPQLMLWSPDLERLELLASTLSSDFDIRVAVSLAELMENVKVEPSDILLCEVEVQRGYVADLLQVRRRYAPDSLLIVIPTDPDETSLRHTAEEEQGMVVVPPELNLAELRVLCLEFADRIRKGKALAQTAGLLEGLIGTLVHALEIRQPIEAGHSWRVAHYALALAEALGVTPEERGILRLGALLHDIGKLTLPGLIFGKPGELTEEEMAIARAHTSRGSRLLCGVLGLKEVRDIVRWHHEAYDGSGYPDGLKGAQIPLLARIVAVAEAYDAMTTPRPYQSPMDHDAALAELERASGKQFDPEVVRAMVQLRESRHVWKVLEQATDLPVMPPVLTRALELLCAAEPDLEELGAVLGSDPGFAARILRYANSAKFAPLARITDVRRALVALGINQIHRLVLAASSRQLLATEDLHDLWRHSLLTAYAAELIACESAPVLPNEAFVAGLLHDLGKVVLCRCFSDAYRRVLRLVDAGVASYVAETVVFGTDHAKVGAWLAAKWELPESLCEAMRQHHDAAVAVSPLVATVALANEATRFCSGLSPNVVTLDGGLLERCDQTPEKLIQIAREAEKSADLTISILEGQDVQSETPKLSKLLW
jgi:putative nucleotidyltransferase with HDIG domain